MCGAAALLAAILFVAGYGVGFDAAGPQPLAVVLYMLAALCLVGGAAAFLLLRARALGGHAPQAGDLPADRKNLFRVLSGVYILFLAASAVVGGIQAANRRGAAFWDGFAALLFVVGLVTAAFVVALVWNGRRK